ncbi:MAG: hypothetical protein PHU51_05460 [Candidatus Nanoarchaeia archaeon]|nr:hypothetical protein [Candidatus Nanoarchaeia archaeon]
MGQIKFILGLIFTFLVLSSLSLAENYGACAGTPVCGISPPQSVYGYGAVEICGQCFACNSEVSDGVCPEDFTDGLNAASCANCPDVDCGVPLTGRVFRSDRAAGIPGIDIYVSYASSPLIKTKIATSGNDGLFQTSISSGHATLFVVSENYDSDFVPVNLVRGTTDNHVDIEVVEFVCTSNCTGAFGNYCKASCNGINNCSYYDVSVGGVFKTADQIATLCDYVPLKNQVSLGEDEQNIYSYVCCNKGVSTVSKDVASVGDIPQTKVDISNLRSTSIPVTLYGKTYYLVVNVWNTK